MKKNQQQSSVLLIDHQRQLPLARFRSMGLDKKIVETSLDVTVPHGFYKYTLQNSCDNLLCFAKYGSNADKESVCLVDLVSKTVLVLPKPDHQWSVYTNGPSYYGVGFDRRSGKYKTLRIDTFVSEGIYNFVKRAEVNTVGEERWMCVSKDKDHTPPVKLPSGSIFGKPVTIDGGLVWADFPQTDALSSSQRFATVFSFDEGKFSSVRYPPRFKLGHLVGLDGYLCAADLSSDSYVEIWILKDLLGSWDKLCRIVMRGTRGEKDHRRTRVLGSLENGALLLRSYGGAYFAYEPATERLEYLHLPLCTDPETEVHCYNGEL